MPRIHITTLGGLRIQCDGEEIRDLPAQPVRCALFLYLALERGATRDELTALLWPERDTDRARHSLSQTLYELRRRLGDGWVGSRGEHIAVTPAVRVDALEFVAAMEAGSDEEALAAYGRAFLEGVHTGETAGFQAWVDGRRSQLSRLYRQLCRRLTATRLELGDLEGALSVARRWTEADPLEDEAQHRLIELLAATGQRTEALRQYESYEELLARELEVEPLEETRALIDRIRAGEWVLGGSPGSPEPSAPPDGAEMPREESQPAVTRSGVQPPGVTRRQVGPLSARVRTNRRRLGWAAGLLAAALVAGTAMLWVGAKHSPPAAASEESAFLDPLSIAVLPFVNMSADPEKEYFSDGMTEDLLTSLSRIRDLRVISRTSVMRYKRTEIPIPEIARELGVRYILEGSVRRDGDRVRITAQLIDASSDAHLWGEAYDRDLSGVFQIQSEIAGRIAAALRQQLSPASSNRIAAVGTASLTAYDLHLKGREYLNRPGEGNLRKYPLAMGFFRQAIEIEPGYARGYAGLSEAFRRHVALPLVPVRRDSMLLYARRAVELDPHSAEAATELGFAYLFAGERSRTEAEFQRALALDPNQPDAMNGLARLSALAGRLDDALRWQRQVVARDPFSAQHLYALGSFHFDLGDLPGAEAAFERVIALAPDHPEASYLLAQVHLLRGEPEQAEERMRTLMTLAGDQPGAHFVMARFHADRGRYREAEAQIERSPLAEAPGVLTFRALVARKLGQQERAAALFRGTAELLAQWEAAGLTIPPRGRLDRHILHDDPIGALATVRESWRTGLRWHEDPPHVGVYWIDHEPGLEELRSDPDFQRLLRQIRTELDSMRRSLQP